jgi:hypothetical protein
MDPLDGAALSAKRGALALAARPGARPSASRRPADLQVDAREPATDLDLDRLVAVKPTTAACARRRRRQRRGGRLAVVVRGAGAQRDADRRAQHARARFQPRGVLGGAAARRAGTDLLSGGARDARRS